MRYITLLLATLFSYCFSHDAMAIPMRIVVYGDSLISGYNLGVEESYAGKLARKLREIGYVDIDIQNMGSPTQTSSSGLEGLPLVLSKSPDVVVVQLGNNDIWRGINIGLINSNLTQIVSQLRSRNIHVVLLGTQATNATSDSEYASRVSDMYSQLGKLPGVSFYPYVLQGIIGNPDYTLADGYHPNSKGMDVLVNGTLQLVDAGIRARWNERQQEEYRRQVSASYPSGTGPPGTVVVPEGSAPEPTPPPQP